MGEYGHRPLFETKEAKGRISYRLFAVSIFICICFVFVYRVSQVPGEGEEGRWAWIGLFVAELWFTFYWVLTQSVRWNSSYCYTFKERLSHKYEKELPKVDIFVCTADPEREPPIMVINTVLSAMAYDYPPENLRVYLSDDGGSELTFYALLEASRFSKHWVPFCKKFNVEPRSPVKYFSTEPDPLDNNNKKAKEWSYIKELYQDMENRIEATTKLGRISKEIRRQHKGFLEWAMGLSPHDHQTILQILIDRKDPNALDIEGHILPTLVYMAREKRPQHHHNFKAGAMNALIRVSSEISNGKIILNVDCDMYPNNSNSVRDALCFLMDEEKGHEIAFVQFPQSFDNSTKNDIYGNDLRVIMKVELTGTNSYGGPLYIGTGCFHRRDALCGRKYNQVYRGESNRENDRTVTASAIELEERSKVLASCTYEENTQWGKEMGLMYGCPVEDVLTGLSIQCRGWKSVYFNPERKGFLGVAPTTLAQVLVQHKRWTEGDLQIFLSKYNPFLHGHGRLKLGLQMAYSIYCLWPVNCFATLYYVVVPSLCLLKGTPLFPKISSLWFLPFVYVIIATYTYSLCEFLWSGGTIRGWWNDQRMWMFKRTTSYLFGFIDAFLKLLGLSSSAFVITNKVANMEALKRYEQEIMEFGGSSPMFTILAMLALLNLTTLVVVVIRIAMEMEFRDFESLVLQILLCGLLVLINLPVYQGLFFRKDKGRLPTSLVINSAIFALVLCLISLY